MFFSVITPTYNRAYILDECYQSLVRQSFRDFEWIVVDDGSEDNTKELVQSFIAEQKIKIRYIHQPNGGKHRAHNTGVKSAKGMLTVCLDSDDRLTGNALEKVCQIWNKYKGELVAGIIARRGSIKTGQPICSSMPDGVRTSAMFDLIYKYKFEGDTVLFFRTELLKENLFREFEGEKFLTETSMYFKIDQIAPMVLSDQVLYLCEYLPDGLTASYFKLLASSPKGAAYTYYQYFLSAHTLLLRVKFAVLINAYLFCIKDKDQVEFIKHRFLLAITKPLGAIYFKKKIWVRL